MISVRGLTKQYGDTKAVDDLTFDVEPGTVTGFLGPNGAGKSTTMRIVMGLDRPTSGSATVRGRRYVDLPDPAHRVGALLDAGAVHPGRTGRAHLRIAARSLGLPRARVEEVLDQVGLTSAAGRRIRGYSLGMRQRLGIASALLGDPEVLLFDEPVNGLDLDGVLWVRSLLRGFADEGRTVLVSSHLMSEMQVVADRLVVIGRGRLIADTGIEDMLRGLSGGRVRVRSPRAPELARAIGSRYVGAHPPAVEATGPDELEVTGLAAAEVGDVAHRAGVPLHHLADVEQSLEQAYLSLTGDSVVHHATTAAPTEGATR